MEALRLADAGLRGAPHRMTALVADWIFAKGLVIGLLIAAPVGPA